MTHIARLRALYLLVFVLGGAVMFAFESHARADDSPAFALKQRGDAAMDTGRPADALTAYDQAYALTKDPTLLYNRARAHQALTHYPEALVDLEAFEASAPPDLKARVPGLDKLIAEVRGRVSTLTIVCNVDGARVLLRDRVIGVTPIAAMKVNSGRAHIELAADGYFPVTRELEMPPGGAASLDVRLDSTAKSGVLIVRSSVAGASVEIDGRLAGEVPLEAIVPAGMHRLTLQRSGYEPFTTTAVVDAGQRKTVDLAPEAKRSIVSTWWFWTSVGVVVAGGVALTIALTTERSPDQGNLPPGVVSIKGMSF